MEENKRMIIDPCDKNGEPLDIGMDVFTDDGHMSSIESFQWDGKEWCAVLAPFATYNHDGSVDTFIQGSYKTSELTVKPKLVVEPEEDMDDEDVDKRITAQMRVYLAEHNTMGGMIRMHFDRLFEMCDAIDKAHEALRDQLDTSERQKESYREDLLAANKRVHASYNDGFDDGFDDGFASADDWLANHEDAMAEHGWVKLPVDADGVPIRVGDVMDGNRGTVTCIRDAGHGWEIVTDHMYSYNPADLHHRRAPTVEDVLYDSLRHFGAVEERTSEVEEWLHKQAAKLRLVGDAE